MKERYTTYYVNKIKPVDFCGKPVLWELNLSGAFELPFQIESTEGEHDFNKCKGCKENLNELIKRLKGKFEGSENKQGFPFCCSYHSNLVKVKEFDRALFVNVPEMVAKKVIYTNQHIINNHNSENWYKKITDYIEFTVESFGQMPKGCGEPLYLSDYLFYITDLLKEYKGIPPDKKNRIFDYINLYQTPSKNTKTDLNILLSIYQKWLKEFPFDLNSYFGNLKQHFEKQLPIFSGKPEVNIYSGMSKVRIHTKSSLFEALINLTDNLLTQINGVTLYEKGLITDANKIKLELVISSRKLKLKQGYKSSSSNREQQYRKILKEWFNDEKKFLDEITPLLKALPPQPTEIKTDLPKQLIVFNKPKTIELLYNELKGYFTKRETDFKRALQGEKLESPLLFPHNQNKFVEVFRRAKYNGFVISSSSEIRDWLYINFEFRFKRGKVEQPKSFNKSTVWDILTKGKNEPPKKERICFENVDWLPYKSKMQLDREAQKEQL